MNPTRSPKPTVPELEAARYLSARGQQLGWSEVWQERNQARVTKSGEISEHLCEKPLEKLSIQVAQ